jgi:hypothetical protein
MKVESETKLYEQLDYHHAMIGVSLCLFVVFIPISGLHSLALNLHGLRGREHRLISSPDLAS